MPTLPSPHPTFYTIVLFITIPSKSALHRYHPPQCSVSLGDNSWIICMPAPPMVIHHGLQALSTAFLCEMHHTEYLLRSHGRQDKTPNIQKLAYPSMGPWPPIYRQSQDWDRWKIKEMQFSNTCVEGTTICIFRALHHDLWSRAAFNAAFYEFRLWRTLAVPLKHSFCVLCAMSWTGRKN